jgi:hypothetical protein
MVVMEALEAKRLLQAVSRITAFIVTTGRKVWTGSPLLPTNRRFPCRGSDLEDGSRSASERDPDPH